jgi:hypothetical protein
MQAGQQDSNTASLNYAGRAAGQQHRPPLLPSAPAEKLHFPVGETGSVLKKLPGPDALEGYRFQAACIVIDIDFQNGYQFTGCCFRQSDV